MVAVVVAEAEVVAQEVEAEVQRAEVVSKYHFKKIIIDKILK